MKIAIFGEDQNSIIFSKKFSQVGANVTLFSEKLIEAEGLDLRQCRVSQVSKVNLVKGETVGQRSRLCDLFRVIFEMNTEKLMSEQKEDNPTVFEKLSQSMVSTLKGKIEMAEDFDLILDMRPGVMLRPLGKANAYALNERIYQGHSKFLNTENNTSGDILVFGEGDYLARALVSLSEKQETQIHLFWPKGIHKEKFLSTVSSKYLSSLNGYFESLEKQRESNRVEHEKKMVEWDSLEDYVKVKHPKPVPRKETLVEYEQMGIVSIDRLEEHDKFFVTFEPYNNFENNYSNEIKTLSVDYILNAQVQALDESIYRSLQELEDGLFKLGKIEDYDLDDKFNFVFSEVKKYFSKN